MSDFSAQDLTVPEAIALPWRGVVQVAGADAESFLQNLITQDLDKLGEGQALWSAFLTPQGKYNHDFFILRQDAGQSLGQGAGFLLECEAERAEQLCSDFLKYRLRADLEMQDLSRYYKVQVFVCDSVPHTLPEAMVFRDPRKGASVWRSLTPMDAVLDAVQGADTGAALEAYEQTRIRAAWPDGSRDFRVGKDLPAEGGMDRQGALDWHKGCYLGQEVTTRVYRRGLLKHRLVPVIGDSPLKTGTAIRDEEGKPAGEIRSVAGTHGLAMVLLAKINLPLFANESSLKVCPADWQEL